MDMETEIKGAEKTPEMKKLAFERSTFIILFLGFILFKAVPLVWNNVEISVVREHFFSLVTGFFPILAGLIMSFITWHVMYLDSAIPGVNPPTPLSPSKYRKKSYTDIHLNFIFALSIGPLVTLLVYSGIV